MKEIGLGDGVLWCKDCEAPLLSQGGYYVHPWELTKRRLRELRRHRGVVEQLCEWVLYKLKRFCPEHGEAPPIAEEIPLSKEELLAQLQTKRGIDDFYDFVQGIFLRPCLKRGCRPWWPGEGSNGA